MSLKLRIFVAFVLLAAFFVLGLSWATLRDVRPQPLQATEDVLVETANLLAALLEREWAAGAGLDGLAGTLRAALDRELAARIYDHTKRRMTLRVYVTDARGRVLYDSAGEALGRDFSRWNDVARTLRGEYGSRATRADPGDPLSSVHYVAAPVRAGGRVVGVVSVGKPVESIRAFLERTERRLTLAALAAVAAAALASLALATWLTLPLRRLERYAAEIGRGGRPQPPRFAAPELLALGRSLESMRDALEGKRYVEGYVRSLTHEIKAPLAGIRASAELLDEEMPLAERRRFLGHVRGEVDRLQALVDRMLELSALEARKRLERVHPVDVPGLVQEVRESMEPLAQQKGLALSGDLARLPVVRGDALLLRQALANLVLNAIHATPSGGSVRIVAAADASFVRLSIFDSGPGVPEFALPRVFERFYSVPTAGGGKPGTGLGLPFAREVALLHGGDVTLANVPAGGCRAELSMRVADA